VDLTDISESHRCTRAIARGRSEGCRKALLSAGSQPLARDSGGQGHLRWPGNGGCGTGLGVGRRARGLGSPARRRERDRLLLEAAVPVPLKFDPPQLYGL
jgi:hypothetical protein